MMRRTMAAAALALALVALAGLPAVAAPAASTTSTTTFALGPEPTTTTAATTTTLPITTTTVAATSTTVAPIARARAGSAATVTIATSGANCSIFCFSPAQLTIAAGATVTFANPTGADHTVRRCTPAACNGASGGTGVDPSFSSATLALPTDASFSYTFSQPGTYVYYCTLHGYGLMHGTITVTAAAPTTTTIVSDTVAPPTTAPGAVDPNALASTGGAPDPLIAIAGVLLVVGLAAIGLTARGRAERSP
jgi:plastocyanin